MADRIETFHPSCAAGGASAANFTFNDGFVERLEVYIPRGHAGLTKILVTYGAFPVIPFQAAAWLTGDDKLYGFDIDNFPSADQWGATLTNSDVYAHSWEVRFLINEIPPPDVGGDASNLPVLIVPYA